MNQDMNWDIYKEEMKKGIDAFVFDKRIASIINRTKEEKRNIFIAGNGGSAAISLGFACDLNKCAIKDWKNNNNRFRALSLVGETSYITAISNDEQYEDVFVEQLKNFAKPGDVLIVISSGGNSPNVVNAAEWANQNGLTTISFTGFKGGKLKKICEYNAHVAADDYGISEDVHSIFTHYLTRILRDEK